MAAPREDAPLREKATRILVLGAAALFLAGGVALAGYCLNVVYDVPPPETTTPAPAPVPVPSRPTVDDWRETLAKLRQRVADPPAIVQETPPPKPTAEQLAVNRAIDRGVAHLKADVATIKELGGNKHGELALATLTLLECGVAADDPLLGKAVADIRQDIPSLNTTYNIAATILLLDRLGRKDDKPLIRRLALELAASQNAAGGWSYATPQHDAKQLEELEALLSAEPAPVGRETALAKLPAVCYQPGQKPDTSLAANVDDNSNTQFAALALWVARKHGAPVDRPLAFVGARFHATQDKSGAWGYVRPHSSGDAILRDSMTCAGLLGLAVARGVDETKEPKAEAADEQIEKALRYLSQTIRRAAADPIPNPNFSHERPISSVSDGDLYYLWSLERVGVLYDLKTIGGVDWHVWGTKLLVAVQNADGSWSERWGERVGTCFALLFLKRVNVAEDLTTRLALLGKVQDPLAQRTISPPAEPAVVSRPPEPTPDPEPPVVSVPAVKPVGPPPTTWASKVEGESLILTRVVPRTITKTVPETVQVGNKPVTRLRTVQEQVYVAENFGLELKDIKGFDTANKPIDASKLVECLQAVKEVVVSANGQPIDEKYRKSLKEDAILLEVPQGKLPPAVLK